MERLKITSKKFNSIIKTVVKCIKDGKILVCPTDTVYGLVCDATNQKAVKRLFKIKKRPSNKPLPVFVRDLKMAKGLAFIDEREEEFLKSVWPGRVTAILKRLKVKSPKLPKLKIYGVDNETIGLRIPKHKLILELLKKIDKPLTGTSANISGKPASTEIKEILKQFENQKHQPDLIIETDNLPKKRPSKIIDLTVRPPKILR